MSELGPVRHPRRLKALSPYRRALLARDAWKVSFVPPVLDVEDGKCGRGGGAARHGPCFSVTPPQALVRGCRIDRSSALPLTTDRVARPLRRTNDGPGGVTTCGTFGGWAVEPRFAVVDLPRAAKAL